MKAYVCIPLLGALLAALPGQTQDMAPARPPMPSASGLSAHRADFTFRVPVRLTHIHADARLAVNCVVSAEPSVAEVVMHPLGHGSTEIPVDASGSYSGTVIVPVDASEGRDPSTARSYYCHLLAGPTSGPVATFVCSETMARCPSIATYRSGSRPYAAGMIP